MLKIKDGFETERMAFDWLYYVAKGVPEHYKIEPYYNEERNKQFYSVTFEATEGEHAENSKSEVKGKIYRPKSK